MKNVLSLRWILKYGIVFYLNTHYVGIIMTNVKKHYQVLRHVVNLLVNTILL